VSSLVKLHALKNNGLSCALETKSWGPSIYRQTTKYYRSIMKVIIPPKGTWGQSKTKIPSDGQMEMNEKDHFKSRLQPNSLAIFFTDDGTLQTQQCFCTSESSSAEIFFFLLCTAF